MANFNFNEENNSIRSRNKATASTGFARKLIAWGLAKNEKQANIWLLGIVAVCAIITIYNLTHLK